MRHANFEFSTLSTVGGVGFRDKEIYTHSEFYIIVDYHMKKYILHMEKKAKQVPSVLKLSNKKGED